VILGPTAAGKTAIAALIARENGWDILSCDSRQLYRGMTIGTAKPDDSMRASVHHWLIDVLDPDVSYSAWDFAREAGAIIRGQAEQGRGVLVCGGTGLYFECLRKGIAPQTASDPTVRERLQRRAELEGSTALHAELEAIDPATIFSGSYGRLPFTSRPGRLCRKCIAVPSRPPTLSLSSR
jgi:tRNA dimethylallyltransferase